VDNQTSSPHPHLGTEEIDLSIPARPEYVVVVRLVAAGIAGRLALSFDDVEDLKIAVGEACTAAIVDGGEQVRIQFEVAAERLTIKVIHDRPRSASAASTEERELGLLLMRCLMDDVRMETNGAQAVTWMTKHLQR
jgi:serine/threonine-protein kinase RsbW